VNDHMLESLLEAAGRSVADTPAPSSELADRVRRRHARRQHRRKQRRRLSAGVAAAMVLLGGTLAIAFRPTPPGPQPDAPIAERPEPPPTPRRVSDSDLEKMQAELAALEAEVERRRRHVRQMLDRRQRHDQLLALLNKRPPSDPLETARITLEKTAFRLVYRAEHRSALAGADAAREQYRQVVELFPNTAAAAIAREQLRRPAVEKGDL